MLLLLVLAAAALYFGVVWMLPRLMALIVSGLALVLGWQARRETQTLLAARTAGLRCDRKPSRAVRRAMRRSLLIALDQTELRSLFPLIVATTDR